MKEFNCIDHYFSPLAKGMEGALNLKDDGALIDLGGEQIMVITSDACVEGVHFPVGAPADIIARRALRVNLSDLAAMGAIPLGYTHTLALTKAVNEQWFEKYVSGLQEDQKIFHIHLLGGDTVLTPGPLSISINAFGRVEKGLETKRSGAMAGDRVYVTGFIGDAYLGRKILNGSWPDLSPSSKEYLINRYYLPIPRIFEADKLKKYVNAAIDISDGLIGDLKHICEESQQRAFIDITRIPLSEAAKEAFAPLSKAEQLKLLKEMITAGDDYELIITISPDKCSDALFCAESYNYQLTQIGHLGALIKDYTAHDYIIIVDEKGEKITFTQEGYEHSW